MMETEHRLITGQVLNVDRATRVLTAEPDAYLKIPLQSLGKLGQSGGIQTNALTMTNGFIEVWSKRFRYTTNRLEFTGQVRANYLETNVVRGKLTCELLTIRYGDQVENMTAEQNVELEQVALSDRPPVVSRHVASPRLEATFSKDGHLQRVFANEGVVFDQEENRPEVPKPTLTKLTCQTVTGFFVGATNRLEKMVAEQDVVFTQDGRVAHSTNAVYTTASGLVELLGNPTATMPEGRITEAERLIWDRGQQRFRARGKFKSEWKRPEGVTNRFTLPTAKK
jgi:hypothetical protein